MSNDTDRQPMDAAETPTASVPSSPKSAGRANTSYLKKRRIARVGIAAENFLKEIPWVGKFFILLKESFGWKGLLQLAGGFLAGFLAAVALSYTGFMQGWFQHAAAQKPPAEPGDYVLMEQNAALLQALNDAESKLEASGVALTFIDPFKLKEKIEKDGFRADIVVLDPCSDAVLKRTEHTGHDSGAKDRIELLLKRLKAVWGQLLEDKRKLLQVRLSTRPATMIVVMLDDRRDLYTYWCPFKEPCTSSHILVFKDYGKKDQKHPAGQFFERHYNAVFDDASPVDFKSFDPQKPCPAASPAAKARR